MSEAGLVVDGQLWCASARPEQGVWGGALWRLVDGVYSELGPDARLLLRGRLLYEGPLDAFSWGLLKVAARRAAQVERLPELPRRWVEPRPWGPPPWAPPDWAPPARVSKAEVGAVLAEMEALCPRLGPRWSQDRPLAALRCSAEGEVLAWGWNQGSRSPTRHAELMALRGPAPRPGERLWCSLKPCRMCAGALALALCPGSQVLFRDPDPGRQARSTILDRGSEDARRFGAVGVEQRSLDII
jgi:tRNA(Arg) A34 adenosine deaminase TadA